MNKRKDSLARLEQHGIRRIPAGWTQSRVKYLARYINGFPFKPDDWGISGRPILRIQDLNADGRGSNRYDGELDARYLVRPGDILISWSASLGVYRWSGEEAWLNQHIFKVQLDSRLVIDEYFAWLAEWFIGEMSRDVHGSTMQHLTADAFGGFPVLLPPPEVQQRIATFLTLETARQDALVVTKERMLALMTEKRHALAANLVLRGLKQDARVRDSGVPWIGDIPEHWELERTRWLFEERDDRSETGVEEMLTVSHLTGVTRRSEKDVNMFEAETTAGYKLCNAGEFVTNTLWAWMGAMGVAPEDGIVSPAYNVYRIGPRLVPEYVDSMVRLRRFAQEVTRFSKGVWSSRLRLYPEGFFEVLMPVPPLDEQRAIAARLSAEFGRTDALRHAVERSLVLLKERRSALIAAAVTGALKVA